MTLPSAWHVVGTMVLIRLMITMLSLSVRKSDLCMPSLRKQQHGKIKFVKLWGRQESQDNSRTLVVISLLFGDTKFSVLQSIKGFSERKYGVVAKQRGFQVRS